MVEHLPHLETSRRIRHVTVPLGMLRTMLTTPPEGVSFEIQNGIPQGAGVVGGSYDPTTQSFLLFIAHESFDELKPGALPPEHIVNVRAVMGEQDGTQG